LLEDTWTGIIDILKEFATTPRMLLISGISNKAEATEFTNKDVAEIDRVIVEAGNPLLNTLAGRIQVAQDLVQNGLATKEEYLSVLTTGQLEPAYKFENSQQMMIKEENEQLQNGKPVKVMNSDNHPLHFREHSILLNSPEIRNNPDPNDPIANGITKHMMEHLNAWSSLDPRIGVTMGIPPAPQPPQPQSPPPPKESISYKDLPPEGQIQMAAQAGIKLGQPGAVPPMGQPANSATPPMPHGVNTGRENPSGAKAKGSTNIPGLAQNTQPGSAPHIAPPGTQKLPPGSPAINQEALARMPQNLPPQMPQ
jgi:hypothetical protein